MTGINSEITKPSQCVLGLGIPTSRNSFIKSLQNRKSDYVNRYGRSWPYFKKVIFDPLYEQLPIFHNVGLSIEQDLTLEKFGTLFNNFNVIILFSHWKDDNIEFHEGLIPIVDVVNAIPDEFEGVLDLSICHPTKLGKLIRAQKKHCRVKFINIEVDPPLLWFSFYSVLFQYLNTEKKYYLDALEDVISEYLKLSNEK